MSVESENAESARPSPYPALIAAAWGLWIGVWLAVALLGSSSPLLWSLSATILALSGLSGLGVGYYLYERQRVLSAHLAEAVEAAKDRQQALSRESAGRARAVHALALARDEAESASRSKSTFLANMSHEMRTPLNAIIGYSELLQEELADEPAEDLGHINSAARHLLRLISDVLDLSKVESGQVEVVPRAFDLDSVVHEIGGRLRARIEVRGNEFVVERGIAGNTTLVTDRTKLLQCLDNLLDNAAKFTSNGTVTLSVSTERRDDRSWYVFEVRDTGIGISESTLPHLFQAFTQEDGSTTRRFGGTGLGLALTRHYCAMLSGELSVESEPGRGTCFRLALPELDEAPTAVHEEEDALRDSARPIPGARAPF